jgi:hypothetical protein
VEGGDEAVEGGLILRIRASALVQLNVAFLSTLTGSGCLIRFLGCWIYYKALVYKSFAMGLGIFVVWIMVS